MEQDDRTDPELAHWLAEYILHSRNKNIRQDQTHFSIHDAGGQMPGHHLVEAFPGGPDCKRNTPTPEFPMRRQSVPYDRG